MEGHKFTDAENQTLARFSGWRDEKLAIVEALRRDGYLTYEGYEHWKKQIVATFEQMIVNGLGSL